MEQINKKSFQPILPHQPSLLILGSLPGDMSIQLNQYYGHPRNRFWKIIFDIFKGEYQEDYILRKQFAENNKIAIWDVAQSAYRDGSLDTAIKDEIPNDINAFIIENPNIKKVIFNGKKAEQMYLKYFPKLENITYHSLPSTSPANANYSYNKLISVWSEVILNSKN
ncbi:DNA-deoxyinosine glycosylase [Faecalibacter rhinopitheci]|uniref:DNA-deoxyinosine glycosylase n=1 Tax=Faecalibacter rhinopitheci TaxID=2779678 RepID=UPI001D1612A9|nr:DNA-deoxyinosine glycosylase [Faecalibacter rhinopitheci]